MTAQEMFEWLDQFMIEALIFPDILAFDKSGDFKRIPSARAARLTFIVDPELKTTNSVEAPSLTEAIGRAAQVRQEYLDKPRSS